MTQLQGAGGSGYEHCVICGGRAVGPCAQCELPVCGDCVVLTVGSTKPYAVCLRCERSSGSSLRRGWLTVLGWVLIPILALGIAVAVLGWLFG